MPSRLRISECGRIAAGFFELDIKDPAPELQAISRLPIDVDHPVSADALSRQQDEPVHLYALMGSTDAQPNGGAGPQVYGYRNVLYSVKVTTQTREEIILRLKKFALTRERAMAKLRVDVADLEQSQ